jgi:hypothetical protein
MAEENSGISRIVSAIRSAVYGKDIRKAIADGIEQCYERVSGSAIEAATDRAREASEDLTNLVTESSELMDTIAETIDDVDELVTVSEEQPTSEKNVIWIKPQPDVEHRIASYEAYSALWDYVNDLNETYNDGHGGVSSIVLDENYVDESEEQVLPINRRIRRYVVTFADGTQNSVLMTSPVGSVDTLQENGIVIEYAKGVVENGSFVKTPPDENSWNQEMPSLDPGDYLWTRTKNVYKSGNVSTIYSVSKLGNDGVDGVTSIKLGSNGVAQTGDIVIPIDNIPTEGHTGQLISSAGVWTAIENLKDSPAFTGAPTAPTPPADDNSTKIATTEYVNRAFVDVAVDTETLFDSPNFTGTPTSVTPGSIGADGNVLYADNMIATTEYVQTETETIINKFLAANFGWPNLKTNIFVLANKSARSSNYGGFSLYVPKSTFHLIKISSDNPDLFDEVLIVNSDSDNNVKYTSINSSDIGTAIDITVDGRRMIFTHNETGMTFLEDKQSYVSYITDIVFYADLSDNPNRNVYVFGGRFGETIIDPDSLPL